MCEARFALSSIAKPGAILTNASVPAGTFAPRWLAGIRLYFMQAD
jgi:hypothetical protein